MSRLLPTTAAVGRPSRRGTATRAAGLTPRRPLRYPCPRGSGVRRESGAAGLSRRIPVVSILVLVPLALGGLIGCRPRETDDDRPLRLDSGEAARLLGTTEAALKSSAASEGINYRCHVCHMNYAAEKLAAAHAAIGVGCEKCHGQCNEHCADEDNITPPTILFPRSKIVPSCVKCHADDNLAGMAKHKPALTATKKWLKVCTDCHGDHRLTVRTRRWDKQTGKLIFDDGVRMIRQPKPK